MWAAKVLNFGSRWMVGDGRNIIFWEDLWLGSSLLAIQYWDLYCYCREQCKIIRQVWDGHTLKITFRRNFDESMMNLWLEPPEVAKSISSTYSSDSLIWQYESLGQYSSSSLHAMIIFRGWFLFS